jgi:hypothetical protein
VPKRITVRERAEAVAAERAALDLWANHVRLIVAQAQGANVTPLRRAK